MQTLISSELEASVVKAYPNLEQVSKRVDWRTELLNGRITDTLDMLLKLGPERLEQVQVQVLDSEVA